METCFRFFIWLIFVFITTSHADCNLLKQSEAGTSYIDTESEDSILTMCLRDKSTLSKWEQYQCEYIQNRNGVTTCWPQRRMSHCTPGNLKGAIFLYHGFSACPNYYNQIAPKLQDECWHVYQPLTVGHGYNYCNSTDPSCTAGRYNLTNLPKSRQQYIDYIKMMIEVIEDEVSIIKQCEANNNIQVAVGGLSFGAPLAAATVLLSGNDAIFTKQLIWSPETLGTFRGIDNDIYHCLFNSPSPDECLGKFWKVFETIKSITNWSKVLSNILNTNVQSEYSAWESFQVFLNDFGVFLVEDTPDIQLAKDILNSDIVWDEANDCEEDIKYRDRGGFCRFGTRNFFATVSFGKYVLDVITTEDDDHEDDDHDAHDAHNNTVNEVETLLILTERDGTAWNSFAVDYLKYFYFDNEQLLQQQTSNCMWLIADQCKADSSHGFTNVCGVPHSFFSVAANKGYPPYYLYWNKTLINGVIAWLNGEQIYNDNFMVALDDWDGSRNQCVELDLIDRPKDLLFQTHLKSILKEVESIDFNKILSELVDGDSMDIDEVISGFVDKLDVGLSMMTLLKRIKKYQDGDDMKVNEFHFHREIIKRIQQNEDFRYWIWKLLDIKIDSVQSLSELLDKIFYKLSGKNLNDKILKFTNLFEEFEYWKHKISELDIDSTQSFADFLDNIFDEFLDDDLKDKIKDYRGEAAKLRRIIYRIQDLRAMDDSQASEKEDESQISMIITLSATNLVIIISFIIYCCSHRQHIYQYQKIQLPFSTF